MIKKLFYKLSAAIMLFSLSFPATPVYAEKITDDKKEFNWDEDTKDNALLVWLLTDWSVFQNRLILDNTLGTSASADVSEQVRALEPIVRSVLTSPDFVTGAEYEREDYVELMLAMIQILAEDCGVFDVESQKNIDSWIDDMGLVVNPDFEKGLLVSEAKTKSIQELFNAYMTACQGYKKKKTELLSQSGEHGDTGDIIEPSLFPMDEDDIKTLQTVLEGVVMKYGVSYRETFTYPFTKRDGGHYTKDAAKNFLEIYHIPEYFAGIPSGSILGAAAETGYIPSANFAKRVMDIYTVSRGNSSFAGSTNNAMTNAFITELEKYKGLPYIWGGKAPSDGGFDCAGLISYCLTQIGYLDGYRNSSSLKDYLERHAKKVISTAALSPGDILWHSGHVAVYISPGLVYEAQQTGTKIGYFKRNTTLGETFKSAYHWTVG